MADFLEVMRAGSETRVAAARQAREFEELWDAALDAPDPLPIGPVEFGIIAEVKTESPAEGVLTAAGGQDKVGLVVGQALAYERGGAAAISVLTEPDRFGGSLEHLRAVASAVSVPVMRKDFLVADYQVVEAREAGASGVLLIARMLSDDDLFEMIDLTMDLGMFCLVEAFDERDLQRVGRLLITRGGEFVRDGGELLLGVNCRDLATLRIEPRRLAELRSTVPSGFRVVAESGVTSAGDAQACAAAGYDLALVGTALMKARAPAETVEAMTNAGRTVRRRPI